MPDTHPTPSISEFWPATKENLAQLGFKDRATVLRLHRDRGLPIVRLGELIFLHDRTVAEWLLAQQSAGGAK